MTTITLRPPTMDDLNAVFAVYEADNHDLMGFTLMDKEEIRHFWESPGFDLQQDARVALNEQGEIVGYIETSLLKPYVRLHFAFTVHPAYRPITDQLLAWLQSRTQEVIALAPAEARIAEWTDVPNKDTAALDSLHRMGYQVIRYQQEMKIELTETPPAPNFPPGITIRTFDPAQDMEALFKASREAFRDHFGFIPTPEAEAFERFVHRTHAEDFDPTIWFVAEENGEIAGLSLCRPSMPEDPNMAWVDSLAVRRPWRRKGLALALLHHTFGEFYRRGKTAVALGVDSQSLTGATRLYEKAGMSIYLQFTVVERTVRAGVDLTTVEVTE